MDNSQYFIINIKCNVTFKNCQSLCYISEKYNIAHRLYQ